MNRISKPRFKTSSKLNKSTKSKSIIKTQTRSINSTTKPLNTNITKSSSTTITTQSRSINTHHPQFIINDSNQQQHKSTTIPTLTLDSKSPLYSTIHLALSQQLQFNGTLPTIQPLTYQHRQFSSQKDTKNQSPPNSNLKPHKQSSTPISTPTTDKDLEYAMDDLNKQVKFEEILSKVMNSNTSTPLNNNNQSPTESITNNDDLDAKVKSILGKPDPTTQIKSQTVIINQSITNDDISTTTIPHRPITPISAVQMNGNENGNGMKIDVNVTNIPNNNDNDGDDDENLSFEQLLHQRQQKMNQIPTTSKPSTQSTTQSTSTTTTTSTKSSPPQPQPHKFASSTDNLTAQFQASARLHDEKMKALRSNALKKQQQNDDINNTTTTSQQQRLTPTEIKKQLLEQQRLGINNGHGQQGQNGQEQSTDPISFMKNKLNEFNTKLDENELRTLHFDEETIKKTREFQQNQEEFDAKLKMKPLDKSTTTIKINTSPTPTTTTDNDGSIFGFGKKTKQLASSFIPKKSKSKHPSTTTKNTKYDFNADMQSFQGSFSRYMGAAALFSFIAIITGRLCKWQIDRRIWKIALLAQREDAIFQDPLAIEDLTTLVSDLLTSYGMHNIYHPPAPPQSQAFLDDVAISSGLMNDIDTNDNGTKNNDGEIIQQQNPLLENQTLQTLFATQESKSLPKTQLERIKDVNTLPTLRDHLELKLKQFYEVFRTAGLYDESSPLHEENYNPINDTKINNKYKNSINIENVMGDDGGMYQMYKQHIDGQLHIMDDTGNPKNIPIDEILQYVSLNDILQSIDDFKQKSQFHNIKIDGRYDYTNEMIVGPSTPPLDHTGFKNVEIQKGFYIITPCHLYEPIQINLPISDSKGIHRLNLKVAMHSVLVNRGWVPQHLLPTYLTAPLTEHECYSNDDLTILDETIRARHDFNDDHVMKPIPYPQYLEENMKLWDQEQTQNANQALLMTNIKQNVIISANDGDDHIHVDVGNDNNDLVHNDITTTQTSETTTKPLQTQSQQSQSNWTWGSLLWGNSTSSIQSDELITTSEQSIDPRITPYSIEYDSKSTTKSATPTSSITTPSQLDQQQFDVISTTKSTKNTLRQPTQQELDANTKWVDELQSRYIYESHGMDKTKLQRLHLGLNDVFKQDIINNKYKDKIDIDSTQLEPYSLITTRTSQPNTPLMPVTGILNYGATIDLYSQASETKKIQIRGLEHKTAYAFLTAPKFAVEMGLSPITMHLPTGQTVSLLDKTQLQLSPDQALLSIHLPIPVIDCQDPVPFRTNVIPVQPLPATTPPSSTLPTSTSPQLLSTTPILNEPGQLISTTSQSAQYYQSQSQLSSQQQSQQHFDTVRLQLKRKGVDDHLQFKTMPETHLGYAITWGSFATISSYLTYLQFKQPLVQYKLKEFFGYNMNAITAAREDPGILSPSSSSTTTTSTTSSSTKM